jgi:hypothetical protein
MLSMQHTTLPLRPTVCSGAVSRRWPHAALQQALVHTRADTV